MKTLFLLLILGLTQSLNASALNKSSVFTGGSLNAAKEKASKENKLLILEFTAKWCLPCRFMEKNVFMNPEVQKYSEEHAIIFPIDIDENKNLKDEYQVDVLPTIILMKASGLVLSRKEESLSAEAFISWIKKNKDSNPESEIATTKAEHDDEPVAIEMPNLETKDFEPELMKQAAEANINKDKMLPGKENNYHLQAGVFNNKANAQNMLALLSLNFQEEAKIAEETKDDTKLYKVCIGNFTNKEEAVIFQQVLEKYKFKAVIRHN